MSDYSKSVFDYSDDDLVSPEIVSCTLGITEGTLAVWRCTGRYPIKYVKVGGRVRYFAGDIKAYLKDRRQTHT